jgi:glycosyltransferase involved in cell wall biosynthesis
MSLSPIDVPLRRGQFSSRESTVHSSTKKQKSILFVTNTNEYGGAEKHLIDLIRRLRKSGVHISILCLDTDLYTDRLKEEGLDGVQVTCVKMRHRSGPKLFWEWFRVLWAARPDVLVFVRACLWFYPWYASLASRLAGVSRCVSIIHMIPPPVPEKEPLVSFRGVMLRMQRSRYLLGLRLLAFFEDSIICVSNIIKNQLVTEYQFPLRRTITIYNGVSLSQFNHSQDRGVLLRHRLGVAAGDFLLVCPARLNEQKGIDILLLAMARILKKGLRPTCVIVGDGPLKDQLHEQARALNLGRHVIFEGFRKDIRPYLQAADAFILTSNREGLPLSILEAMACGLPCIVTDVGGNAEAVSHNVTGLVVPPGSPDQVAQAIEYLEVHPEECRRMSRMARPRVCEIFDIDVRMAEIGQLLTS